MLKGLKRFAAGGLLLRELRGLRQEMAGIRAVLESFHAHQFPQTVQADPSRPPVEVTYVNETQQREFMDIELRLTAARGTPPSEEEILAEWERRHLESGRDGDAAGA